MMLCRLLLLTLPLIAALSVGCDKARCKVTYYESTNRLIVESEAEADRSRSALEKELIRRMEDRGKWTKAKHEDGKWDGYQYGDLFVFWWMEGKYASGYALAWEGHQLSELLDQDARKRVNGKAKELHEYLDRQEYERERQIMRKKADEAAKELKRMP